MYEAPSIIPYIDPMQNYACKAPSAAPAAVASQVG